MEKQFSNHEETDFPEEILRRGRDRSFWCDSSGEVWYKGRHLGHWMREDEWDKDDLELFHNTCAGT